MVSDGRLLAADLDRASASVLSDGVSDEAAESALLRWVASEYDVSFTDLAELSVDPRLLASFPADLLLQKSILPLRRRQDTVEVATSCLFDTRGLDALRLVSGLEIEPVLAPSEAIAQRIKALLGVGADTLHSLDQTSFLQVVDAEETSLDLEETARDASIIRFVNQIFLDGIKQRATDIHLEPFEDEFRIRYRIDGVLQDVPVPTQLKRYQPAIVSRVKILSELDIAEKRLPQDGRVKLRTYGMEVDVRVSVIPMVHGEAVVLRLLRQDSALLRLENLGMASRESRIFRNLLQNPHGIILVTGPTGSGKTTTLYAALQEINDSERKIITVEDPVEYQLKGINQIQVSAKKGLTFSRGLRSILRHDPDVILVGEIRDSETARIAVQASLTGHLVFSTLHTNDSPGAITRLVDMGVEPYLVTSSLEAILAQRLVRLLCSHCKCLLEDDVVSHLPAALRESFQEGAFYGATGCPHCRHTGYHGRRAIFELLVITEDIRELILAKRSSGEIRALALDQGWRPLSEDGWRLVAEGLTTAEEVLRVTRDVSPDAEVPELDSSGIGTTEAEV